MTKQSGTSLFALVFFASVLATLLAFSTGAASARSPEDPRLEEARGFIEKGEYGRGLEIIDDVLEEQPDHRDALFLKALAFEWQGKIEDALTIYRTIVSVHEEDLDAWLEIAKLETRKGNYERAISLYGNLMSRFGEEPPILSGLARALTDSGRLVEALAYYDRVLLQEPDNVQALAGKARVLRLTGDASEARKIIRRAERMEPTFPDVKEESGEIDLVLSPWVTAGYMGSLEKNYLRAEKTGRLDREGRAWLAEAEFYPDVLENLGLGLWTSRYKETGERLKKDNFDVTISGLSGSLRFRPWEAVELGGGVSVVQYENHTENVSFPLLSDLERDENFALWISAKHGRWGSGLGVRTIPVFEKTVTPLLLSKLEIGKETVSHFAVFRSFSKTVQCSLSYEGGNYSDGNNRNKFEGSVQVSTPQAPWLSVLYGFYYQDYTKTSIDYFTPLEELNQRIEIRGRKQSDKTIFESCLRFGLSNSANFNNIFSGTLNGSLSRIITGRLKLEGRGYLSYDDREYSMAAFYVGLGIRL